MYKSLNINRTGHIIRYIAIIFLVLVNLWLPGQGQQLVIANQNLDGVSSMPNYYLAQIDSLLQTKAQLLQSRISGLRSKTLGISKDLDSISNTQAASFLDEKLDNLTPEQYTTQLTEINQSLETYQYKITDTEELKWVEYYSGQLDQLEGVVRQYQDKLLNLEELQELTSYQQQLEQLSGEAGGYFQELQDIVSGGLTDESPLMQQLQSKIGLSKEFQELQAQTAELEQFKQLSQKYGENYAKQQRQKVQERLVARAKEIGADAFKEHQPQVQEVQDKFQKLKKKYRSVADARDLTTAVKRSSLKGAPLSERLVLGGTFQVVPSFSRQINQQTVKESSASVDLSPLIGYRLNRKFTVGLGATYRAQLDRDELPWNSPSANYGGRAFLDYYPLERFFLHGEYESMSSQLAQTTGSDEASRQWVNGGLIGVGKEYPLFKGVKGQVMVLYNFLYDPWTSPYDKAWVIRFGFVI